jgi:hypothetical protein
MADPQPFRMIAMLQTEAIGFEAANEIPWPVSKAHMPTQRLTNEIITAAIEGFEEQNKRIGEQIAELRSLLTGGLAETAKPVAARKRGMFSDAARLRMKEAQQRRWARIKGESEPSTPTAVPVKSKRQLSEAGRQAIAEAAPKRWAAKKAAKESPEPSATKKASRKKAASKKTVVKKAAAKVATA